METNKRKARAWITGEQHGHQWEAIILPPDSCSQAKPVGNKKALTLCSAAVVNTKKQVVQVHFRSHFCPYIQKKAHRWPLCYQHRHRCQGCEIREPSSSCRLPQVGTDKSSAESSKAPGSLFCWHSGEDLFVHTAFGFRSLSDCQQPRVAQDGDALGRRGRAESAAVPIRCVLCLWCKIYGWFEEKH